MKVTIFVTLSDNFFTFFKVSRLIFPRKFYQSPLKGHLHYLASKLLE